MTISAEWRDVPLHRGLRQLGASTNHRKFFLLVMGEGGQQDWCRGLWPPIYCTGASTWVNPALITIDLNPMVLYALMLQSCQISFVISDQSYIMFLKLYFKNQLQVLADNLPGFSRKHELKLFLIGSKYFFLEKFLLPW